MRSHYAMPDGTLLSQSANVHCIAIGSSSSTSSLNLNEYTHAFLFFLSFEVQRKVASKVGLGSEVNHSRVVDQLPCSRFDIAQDGPVAMSAIPLESEIEPNMNETSTTYPFKLWFAATCAWLGSLQFGFHLVRVTKSIFNAFLLQAALKDQARMRRAS